jgi:regulator of RNase E activity RraA
MYTEVLVSLAYIHVEVVDCPVVICGLTIRPVDLIHADIHGFAVDPEDIAPRCTTPARPSPRRRLPVLEPCRKAHCRGRAHPLWRT